MQNIITRVRNNPAVIINLIVAVGALITAAINIDATPYVAAILAILGGFGIRAKVSPV